MRGDYAIQSPRLRPSYTGLRSGEFDGVVKQAWSAQVSS